MNKFLPALLILVALGNLKAQTPNWSNDIAPIIYNNCTKCHHEGGLAPFSLLDYSMAYTYRFSISNAVSDKTMPPWPPDAHYRRFANERILAYSDIIKINAWASAGAPMGDTTQAPTKPIYTNASALGTPDLSVRIPDYTVPSTQSNDIYQVFVIPSSQLSTKFITGIEVLPGNASAVHHVLVYQDTTGQAKALDDATPEPGYTQFGGIGISGQPILIAGWVPGSQPSYLPPNMGIKLYANSDLVLQIHYPNGSANKLDSTRINFKLSNASLRTVALAPILNHMTSLQDGPLYIPANSTKTFTEYFQLPNIIDITLLSVAPHAHLIAKSWLSYAITPTDDTIPLIKINDWDFHWQGSYAFRNLMKIPKQSKLYGHAVYDNTASNAHNPNNPPQNVSVGESTTDEMMLIYFAYTYYQAGDENIVVDNSPLVDITDSSSTTAIEELPDNAIVSTPQLYDPVPNPSNTETQFNYFLPEASSNSIIRIFDLNGRLVEEIKATGNSGFNSVKYNTGNLAKGDYICNLIVNNISRTKNLVVIH